MASRRDFVLIDFDTGNDSDEMTVTNAEDNSTAQAPSGHSSFPGPRAKALAALAHKWWSEPNTPVPSAPEEWAIGPIPAPLANRKVDLVIAPNLRALQSAAKAPVQGIVVDLDALRYADKETYQQAFESVCSWALTEITPIVLLRLRAPVQGDFRAAIEDAVSFLANAAQALVDAQRPLCIELSGVRDTLDAQRWEHVLSELERALSLPLASTRVTLRLDTYKAVRHIDDVIYPLRDRVTAMRMSLAPILSDMILNGPKADDCWQPARQDALTLQYPLADALAKHFTVAAHRRGVLALSGMLPALPIHDDETAHSAILERTAELTRQRLRNGYDGVAFAHSALVDAVDDVFNDMMPTSNQLERPLDWAIQAADLQTVGQGPVSETGLRNNIGVAIQGIEAALQGRTRFALYNQIEDAGSTALCWQQLWQWIHTTGAVLDDGRPIEAELVRGIIAEELEIIRLERESRPTENDQAAEAAELLLKICLAQDLPVFPPVKAAP